METEHNKELVRFLVDEVTNDDDLGRLDQVCSDRFAAELQEWFAPFRAGFPDWRQEIVERPHAATLDGSAQFDLVTGLEAGVGQT